MLSVGAIAGYSKAMFKYKLNKFSESMNMLINNALQTTRSLPKSTTNDIPLHYAEIFSKLQLIPDGMKLRTNTMYIYDVFNNYSWIYSYPNDYGMGYRFADKKNLLEVCQTLINIFKENRHELISITQQDLSSDYEIVKYSTFYYGDDYCTGSRKCLKDMTMDDIYNLCNYCNTENDCTFYARWK